LPGTPAVPADQQLFEPTSRNGAGIQTAIDAAVAAVQAGNAVNPVIHLPSGNYTIAQTLVIPAGIDLQVVGDGFLDATILRWSGPAGGTVLDLLGPSRANLRDFHIIAGQAGNGILVENADQAGARIFMDQQLNTSATQNGILVDGLNSTPVELDDFQHAGVQGVGVSVIGGSARAGSHVDIFAGAASNNGLSYDVSNGGSLLVEDCWYEGAKNQFVNLTDSGSFTLQGARVAPYGLVDRNSPPININGFSGNVAILSTIVDGGLAVQPGTTANVLAMGDLTSMTAAGWIGFFGNSPASAVFANNQGFDGSKAFPLYLQQWPDQALNVPDVNAFLRQLLAQTRNEQPEPQPFAPKADGLTDIGVYRVWVEGGAVGVHLIPLAQPPGGHARLHHPLPSSDFAVGLTESSLLGVFVASSRPSMETVLKPAASAIPLPLSVTAGSGACKPSGGNTVLTNHAKRSEEMVWLVAEMECDTEFERVGP
jgi:hypothetical protein